MTQWHHAKVFFLGLRNINLSKTCHRIPAFSPFFSKCGPKSKWYYSCALFKMCFAKDNIIDVLWCFSGQLFPSCEIQSPGSHQRDAMTIVGRIIISIIKLKHHQTHTSSIIITRQVPRLTSEVSWEWVVGT